MFTGIQNSLQELVKVGKNPHFLTGIGKGCKKTGKVGSYLSQEAYNGALQPYNDSLQPYNGALQLNYDRLQPYINALQAYNGALQAYNDTLQHNNGGVQVYYV